MNAEKKNASMIGHYLWHKYGSIRNSLDSALDCGGAGQIRSSTGVEQRENTRALSFRFYREPYHDRLNKLKPQ